MNLPRYFLLLVIPAFMFSCVKKSEEELMSDFRYCKEDSVSFSQNVLPILKKDCGSCHNANVHSGDVVLETHAQVSTLINMGLILGNIKHESGFLAMPKNANKLNPCKISTIEKWVAEGMQNN